MKKFFILTVLISLVALMPSRLFAADPLEKSSSSKVDAELLSAYSVSNGSALNFGKLIPTATDGTVKIDAIANSCTESNVIKAAGHSYTVASFTINSAADVNWTLDAISDTYIKLNGTDESNQMSVTNFTPTVSSGNTSTFKNFSVGAILHVPANQTIGKYSGSFPVVVTFN